MTTIPTTPHQPLDRPPYRQIAVYAHDDGRPRTYPLSAGATPPHELTDTGDTFRLRMIHHVPDVTLSSAADALDADALAARRRAWGARHFGRVSS